MSFQSPLIMGVLNVTPDSFSDGGSYLQKEAAVRHALSLVEAGADVIDIGGESSRPFSRPVSVQEEIDRVIPVLEALHQEGITRLSIDTVKPEVMQEALRLNVWMVNDIHALQHPEALALMQKAHCQICLMHKKGQPETMQVAPEYDRPVVQEVFDFFQERIDTCIAAGIAKERLWLDPGIGFGKDISHNLSLLKEIRAFFALGLPLMVGVSRKSVLGAIVNQPVHARLNAGLAAAVYLGLEGVNLIRTHDVQETKEAFLVLHAILQGSI